MSQVLSQNEVDALLAAVSEGEVQADSGGDVKMDEEKVWLKSAGKPFLASLVK